MASMAEAAAGEGSPLGLGRITRLRRRNNTIVEAEDKGRRNRGQVQRYME